jgi:nucleoid-associated protein YgaU
VAATSSYSIDIILTSAQKGGEMARKKSQRARRTSSNSFRENILQKIRWDDSYVSLTVGVLVVIIVAVLGILLIRNTRQSDTSSVQFEPTVETEEVTEGKDIKVEESKKNYTVREGDTLWSISESNYKSGYNWVDIASANKISNPDSIPSGSKLTIPDVKVKKITVITPTENKPISGDSYGVVEGDNLWEIAVRAYGDGYSWVKIANENKLADPDIIHVGTVLKLSR